MGVNTPCMTYSESGQPTGGGPCEEFLRMRAALEKAVALYGQPGGPWNVPSEPGAWLAMAKEALGR